MPFNLQLLEAGGGEEVVAAGSSSSSSFTCGGGGSRFLNDKKRKQKGFEGSEPTSVLDSRRSPSPPTSSSTLSSSLGGGGGGGSSDTSGLAAVSETTTKWPPSSSDWAPAELHPIPAGLDMGGADELGAEDWEAILSMPPASTSQEQTFFQWVMADAAAAGDSNTTAAAAACGGDFKQQHLSDFDTNMGFGIVDPGFGFDPLGAMGGGGGFPLMSCGGAGNVKDSSFGAPANLNPAFPPGGSFGDTMDNKQSQLLFGSGVVQSHQQSHSAASPAFFLPHLSVPPQLKRHHTAAVVEPTCRIPSKAAAFPVPPAPPDPILRRPNQPGFPAAAPPYHLQQRPMKPSATPTDETSAAQQQQQQQQALVDHLFQAAKLIEAGNPVSARGILARLNHQLLSPAGKPLLRSAFYFMEALRLVADNPNSSPYIHRNPASNPLDVVLKLGTYNAFSEVSPVLQFANFTCIQALLEELSGSDRIHIIDFDIGVGGQWSSFMQELAQRRSSSPAGTAAPLLKITAFASASSHHPLELHLTRENLTLFANDLGIPFEFNILNQDLFDSALLLGMCGGMDEAVAVNLPVACVYSPPVPNLLRLLKQLSPKIVVSVDSGCHRSDLPLSNQFLHAFQSCTVLLDSIDAAGTDPDVSNKIERFLVRPRIENALLGCPRAVGDKMPPWRTLFAAAGFVPVQFSNFTETQAECLLRRVQVRGFHVEKRQASLVLFWQRGELVSVSAWRC